MYTAPTPSAAEVKIKVKPVNMAGNRMVSHRMYVYLTQRNVPQTNVKRLTPDIITAIVATSVHRTNVPDFYCVALDPFETHSRLGKYVRMLSRSGGGRCTVLCVAVLFELWR